MFSINSIEIKFFRSIYQVKIKNIKHLNIFSGLNDSGKSNLLKALNLFFNNQPDINLEFNFKRDFSKKRLQEVRKESIKGRQFIAIKIEFIRGKQFEMSLPEKFWIRKTWHRYSNIPEITNNIKLRYKISNPGIDDKILRKKMTAANQSLMKFLNKIQFEYIPAIKSGVVHEHLLGKLQQVLLKEKSSKKSSIQQSANDLEKCIREKIIDISKEFEKLTKIKTDIKLPETLEEFFRSLIVDTRYGDYDIPLKLRGDGIKARYIPAILNYITKNTRNQVIWGFEEPENSFEYNLAHEMAEDFKNIYSKNALIFITSHNFNFISLSGENVSLFRTHKYKESNVRLEETKIDYIRKERRGVSFEMSDDVKLYEELGIVNLQLELHENYKSKLKEYKDIEENNQKLNERVSGLTEHVLFTEGDLGVCRTLAAEYGIMVGNKSLP